MARITKSNLVKKSTLPDLPDSNLLSHRRARRPRVVAAAPFLRCWNYKVMGSQRRYLEGLIDDIDDADDEY